MMEKINQQFASFQTVMLQTMKELVINMIPQITNQQRSTVLYPSPTDMLNTQPVVSFYEEEEYALLNIDSEDVALYCFDSLISFLFWKVFNGISMIE